MDHNNEQIGSMRLSFPKSLLFNTYSIEEVKKLSVVKIVTPLSFNAMGHPLPGGLYDPAMGPLTQYAVCSTCGLLQAKCGGHLGHIELPLPVINPLYHKSIGVILKMSCLECHRILIPHTAKCILIGQLSLLHHGYIVEAQELENHFSDLVKAATWDHAGNDTGDFLAAQRVNEYVNSVYALKEVSIKEWRGEVDLRNAYIKEALSKIYKGKLCPFCNVPFKKVSFIQNNILIPIKGEPGNKSRSKIREGDVTSSNYTFLMPSDCNEHLKQLYSNDGEFMKALLPVLVSSKTEDPIDSLFMEVVLVPPINARPVGLTMGVMSEHPQNAIFKSILNDCVVLRSVMHLITASNMADESMNQSSLSQERIELVQKLRGKTNADKLQYAWQDLQKSVDCLIDTELHRKKVANSIGLKQILEKKEGIIRMNMMGKRVNFAARTVITPDPNLNIDEIGVPEAFAKKLTYPVPVSFFNVNELRKLVINGPYLHPGANFVENEDGSITKLEGGDLTQREGLAKKLLTPSEKKGIKIVHRHLMNGDVLLLNRQPTLHKPSIMAHKAKVLKGEKTFRLHYANCKSYNADFDGDEMNAHFPQNEVARSEGYSLVSVGKQYLVPKDGTPLSGLIQDHIVSGVRLSMRGRFFTKEEYMQLSFQGLSNVTGTITFLPPCMIKPRQLWSGKQIISTVIMNIISKGGSPLNLNSQAKISASAWSSNKQKLSKNSPFKENEMSEAEVVIRGGELLCGVLDKMHYGATPFSLIHCVHELYGGEVACSLLSSFSKLFTSFLQTEGFTLGVEDILVVKKADAKRRQIIDSMRQIGDSLAAKALDVESSNNLTNDLAEAHRRDPTFRALLDHQYKMSLDKFTNDINQVCLPSGLLKQFPVNDLQLMVQSGAKGSTVNTMQISCLLGQIELEGRRPPLMISGRSLPSFPPYDTTPRAGGFIDGRFMTGIQPQEFFFHCMAGREGLIDTAVKTSRSGYLQRCLVKHLEGLSVNYDLTVRDSDGSVVQFLYGEDGMEVTKSQFFTKDQMPFLANNVKALSNANVAESLKDGSNLKGLRKHKKSIKKWKKSFGPSFYRPPNPFSIFSRQASMETNSDKFVKKTGRLKKTNNLCKTWYQMDECEKEKFQRLCPPPPDTLVSKYQPDRHFGSITEKLDGILNSYLKTHGSSVDAQMLEDVVHLKALSALANPGEPVGLLAAQSIGEPSTQMTLNTFHFAGRGEMNVTLGIPRLREVLMVASKNIKTPSMEIPFLPDIPKLEKKADLLRRKFCKVTLADVLQTVEVTEELQLTPLRRQLYTLKFNFLPIVAYEDITTVTPKQILRHFEIKFLKELFSNLKSKSAKHKNLIEDDAEGKNEGDNEDDPDDPDEDAGEGSKKKRSKGVIGTGNEHQSSDEEEGDDDDDATAARRRARQNEEHQYSDLEDEDEEVREEIEGGGKSGKNKEEIEEEEENTEELPSALVDVKEAEKRISCVMNFENVVSYSFDTKHQLWCELTLGFPPSHGRIDFSAKLKDLAAASTITRVPGIRKAFLITASNGERLLKTDGKNFGEMYNYRHVLDVNRLYTNDIHAVAEMYGIEAAAKVIVREVQDVFKVYGITVDPRHLTLVADYMTYDGTYRPLSRVGMEGGASPLQQMSFEASTGFLKSSVLRSKRDELMSPSSRLMLGRPVTCGTSAFNLLYSLNNGNLRSKTVK